MSPDVEQLREQQMIDAEMARTIALLREIGVKTLAELDRIYLRSWGSHSRRRWPVSARK